MSPRFGREHWHDPEQVIESLAWVIGRHLGALEGSGSIALAARVEGVAGPVAAHVVHGSDGPRNDEPEPRYLAYSITKTVTASLVLMLCEREAISLEDPLVRWFDDVPAAEEIPLARVLGHTAGLPDYGSLADYHADVRRDPSNPWSFEVFADRTWRSGLAYRPGEGWSYSNPGYMLLRAILEQEVGDSFGEIVHQWIAAPLGLSSWSTPTEIECLADLEPALSALIVESGEPLDVRHHYHPGWVSHGTIASTASDVAAFLHALSTGRLLSETSFREMSSLSPVPSVQVPSGGIAWVEPSYGLGLMGDPRCEIGPIWGHNGAGPGYQASAFHAHDRAATASAMCASEVPFLAERLTFDLLSALGGKPETGR